MRGRQPNGCARVCCERFTLGHTPAQIADLSYDLGPADRFYIPEAERAQVAAMVVPNGDGTYTCRNWTEAGDCAIYEQRPTMCRAYPGQEGCHYSDSCGIAPQTQPTGVGNG